MPFYLATHKERRSSLAKRESRFSQANFILISFLDERVSNRQRCLDAVKNTLFLVLGRSKYMRPISFKTSFLSLTLVAASLMGGVLTGCSNTEQSQNQVPNSNVTDASSTQDGTHSMEHGNGMTHDMAMDLGAADANYDLRFIDAMKLHHQGAVEMAKEAAQKSERQEIKQLAKTIIKDQNQEINQMNQWRQAWYPQAEAQPMAHNSQMGKTVKMSSDQMKAMMMDTDLGAADAQFDLRFINAMTAHHEGAITMAQDALSKSKRPEIKQLAQNIIKAQEAELTQMNQWRQTWYQK